MNETPTIYEWGGGREAFERWLNVFYDLVEGEPELARLFGGTVSAEHRTHVTTWWCEVMGGPATYTAENGGDEHKLGQHPRRGVTPPPRPRLLPLPRHAGGHAPPPPPPRGRPPLGGACVSSPCPAGRPTPRGSPPPRSSAPR